MAHVLIAHPIHSLHLDHVHWEGWVALLASAAMFAFLVVAVTTGAEVTTLLTDPNLAA